MCRKTTATHSKKFHLFVENFKTNKYETQTKENSPLVFIKWNAFVSCSLEEDYATKKRYEEKMKISHVSFGELLKNKKFSTAYSKVLQQQSLTNKTVMEEQYQFTIANKPVKVIETESATSYTILINRAIDDVNSFENLIVQQLNSGETTANIIKYVPFQPATIESYFLNGDFNGNRTVTTIVYNDNLINTTNKITNVCSTVCTTLCYDCDPSYPSEYQIPHSPKERCPKSSTFTSCDQVCVAYDDGGGDSSSNPIDITGGGGTGGTGDLDTPHNDSGNNNPIVTAPVLELEEEEDSQPKFKPCDELKSMLNKLIANSNPPKTVLTNLNDLKTNVTTNKERMYIMSPTLNANGTLNHNLYYENFDESAPNQDHVSADFGNIIIDIMMHTHWDTAKHLSIFSLEDIYEIYKKIASGQINLENKNYFTTLVITAHGTQYAIKFSNIQAFVAWGDNYFIGWDVEMPYNNQKNPFQDAKEKKFYYDTGIKLGNTPEIKASNELGWASFIQTNNLGLELYRVNNSFTEFTKLSTTLLGDLKETPCTN